MKFNDLKTTKQRQAKRVGRGISAGQGKTAGRGTKGYGSRTGSKAKPGFAGGQNPLMQALPKLPGFKSLHTKAENVHTGQLEQFGGKTVDSQVLADAGLVSSPYAKIKLISGKGELTKSGTVKLASVSASALELIQQVGGSFEETVRTQRPITSTKSRKAPENKKEA
ncbi:50S ribosomal protein L15 [Aeromicrobium sp.]|nr:50S ribosomal protein L15 [Candidatus Saccharibacteria bacterium]